MESTRTKSETVLDQVRRALAGADTAAAVLAAGAVVPDLIGQIEAARDALDDEIAAEAESIDRTRTNALRAERTALGDLLTDAEYLERRIDDKHKAMVKAESDASMTALQASALAKQAEAKAIVIKLAAPLRQIMDGAAAFEAATKEIAAINAQLRTGDRNELVVRPPLHSVAIGDEQLGGLFDFLQAGRLRPPGSTAPSALEIANRLKHEASGK